MKRITLPKLLVLLSLFFTIACEKDQDGFNNLEEFDVGVGLYDLYIYDTHTNTNVRISDSPDKGEFFLSFSPDGKKIAYRSYSDVYTMNIDGSDNQLVIPTDKYGPINWLEDGLELYYFEQGDIYKLTSLNNEILPLTNSEVYFSSPSMLSPDSKMIACTSENGFSVVNTSGTIETHSTGGIWSDFDWSSDSKQLTYIKKNANNTPSLYKYSVETKSEELLISPTRYLSQPRFNPKGREILFVSSLASKGTDLMLRYSNGSTKSLVHENRISDPVWAPNGKRIAFINEDSNLVLIDSNGKNYSIVNEISGACMNPHWSPDGRYVIYYRAIFYL